MAQQPPGIENEEEPIVNRSGKFLVYFQAEGLCEALRQLAQTGHPPGPATIQMVKVIRMSAVRIGAGHAFEILPEINDESPMADLLVVAEVVRTLMLAFLTPEEVRDQRRSFGFSRKLGRCAVAVGCRV